MKESLKVAYIETECVACGSCIKVCPNGALTVFKGVRAAVDAKKCVGCGKCEKICPAAVITIVERRTAV